MKNLSFVAASLVILVGCVEPASTQSTKKILVFTKSSNFEHDVVKRDGTNLSFAENILKGLGESNHLDFTFCKDGTFITAENLAPFDGLFFITTGDLTTSGTDHNPPMTAEGKAAFLAAIRNGKGFIGAHCASDTFHSPGSRNIDASRFKNDGTNVDPFIAMIGGEFMIHGSQQEAHQICADPKFPGLEGFPSNFAPKEEWYTLKNFAPDLHVLLVQDTGSMGKRTGSDYMYGRPNYPSTWAHTYGKGRVFYTSMGHRNDVWTNPVFQKALLGGINWAVQNVDADIKPNLTEVTPDAFKLPEYHK